MDKVDYILYGIVIIIFLLIININIVITNNNISKCDDSCVSVFDGSLGVYENYTAEEIIKKWNSFGCTVPLSDDIVHSLLKIPKDTVDGMLDFYKRSTYRCGKEMPTTNTANTKSESTPPAGTYTPVQIEELKKIWKNSKCPAPYPVEYVDTLQKFNFSIGKRKFTNYVKDIIKNNKYNDVYNMPLDKTFAECYGKDWKSDKKLMNTYYYVSSL